MKSTKQLTQIGSASDQRGAAIAKAQQVSTFNNTTIAKIARQTLATKGAIASSARAAALPGYSVSALKVNPAAHLDARLSARYRALGRSVTTHHQALERLAPAIKRSLQHELSVNPKLATTLAQQAGVGSAFNRQLSKSILNALSANASSRVEVDKAIKALTAPTVAGQVARPRPKARRVKALKPMVSESATAPLLPQPAGPPRGLPIPRREETAVLRAPDDRRLEGELRSCFPDSADCLDAARERLLTGSDQSESLAHAALSCRRALSFLADQVYPPQPKPVLDRQGEAREVTDRHFKNRLLMFLGERIESATTFASLEAQISDLARRLDMLVELLGKGVHAKTHRQDIEIAHIQTFSLIAEVMIVVRS